MDRIPQNKQIRTAPHGGRHYHAPVQKTPAKYTYEELLRLQRLSLSEKIAWANERITMSFQS